MDPTRGSASPEGDDKEPLRNSELGLAHEIAEALTAIGAYLHVSLQLEELTDPANRAKLHEAIQKAIEQANRASEAVTELRSSLQSG